MDGMGDMQDLQWLASEIEGIEDIPTLDRIIQTSQGIPALLANDRKTKLQKYQQQIQGAQALAQGQKPPVMEQIKGQAAQQEAARQQQMMQLAQLATLQQPQDAGLAALPYGEEDQESPEYESTEDEGAEEGQGAAVGGLVALAQGGSVDGPEMYGSIEGRKKGFADKTVDNLTGMLHDWYDNSVFNMAQGGPVRGFYAGSDDPLKPIGPEFDAMMHQPVYTDASSYDYPYSTSDLAALNMLKLAGTPPETADTSRENNGPDSSAKLMGPGSSAGFYAKHEADKNKDVFRPWPKPEEGASAGPGSALDYAKGKLKDFWDVQRAADQGGPQIGELISSLSGGPSPTYKTTDIKNYLNRLADDVNITRTEGAAPVASDSLFTLRHQDDPSGFTGAKTENQRAAETQATSNKTTASGTTSELPAEFQVEKTADNLKTRQPDTLRFTDTKQEGLRALGPQPKSVPPANKVSSQAPATPAPTTPPAGGQTTTPPAGGQTVAAPGGQEQGQQRLTNELEQHPHRDEIINTIDDPQLSTEQKIKRIQETLGAPYQMSPELLSKYEKQLADMRSEKGWMTGLSFLTGVLGAKTPWMSQALSEGGIQALGTYGKYAADESKLEQGLLEQQMGIEKAPVEARHQAGLELLKQAAAGQKEAAEFKKALATHGLDANSRAYVQGLRNKGGMDKAAFERQTRLAVQTLVNEAKRAGTPPSPDRANSTAAQLLALDPTYSLMPEGPEKREYFTKFAKSLYDGAVAMHSGQPMGNIGGAGQQQVFNLQ